MKLRIVKQNKSDYRVLFGDGTMVFKKDILHLTPYIQQFKRPEQFTNGDDLWRSNKCLDMALYPGKTMAYVTDTLQLVIDDPVIIMAFEDVKPIQIKKRNTKISQTEKEIEIDEDISLTAIQNYVLNKLVSVKQYAIMQGRGEEQIKTYCRQGRIPGAFLVNNTYYLIPIDAPLPEDNRRRKIIKKEQTPDKETEYVTTNEYSKDKSIGQQMLRIYLREGRISGAVRSKSGVWMIPKDSPLPIDRRTGRKVNKENE